MPEAPSITDELIEIYHPEEMTAHKARHEALMMMDEIDSCRESFDEEDKNIAEEINAKTLEDELESPLSPKESSND